MSAASSASAVGTRGILTTVGEAVYEWNLRSDQIRWGGNVADVLGLIGLDAVATGARYAALVDPATPEGRGALVTSSVHTGDPRGTPFRVQYGLRPAGADGPRLAIEDVGRWFADGRGRPERVLGVVRVLAEAERRAAPATRLDPLTGQLNREALLAALGDASAALAGTKRTGAFVLVGLEGLPAVNAAFGREVGDEAIRRAAGRIRAQLRGGDVIGRVTGSVLGVIVMNCAEKDMMRIGARFADTACGARAEDDFPVRLVARFGATQIQRSPGSASAMFGAAWAALSAARKVGTAGATAPARSTAVEASADDAARFLRAAALGRALARDALAAEVLGLVVEPVVGPRGDIDHLRVEPELWLSNGRRMCAREIADVALAAGQHLDLDRWLIGQAGTLADHPDVPLSLPLVSLARLDAPTAAALGAALGDLPQGVRPFAVEVPAGLLHPRDLALDRLTALAGEAGVALAVTGFGAAVVPVAVLAALRPTRVALDTSVVARVAAPDGRDLVGALVRLARAAGAETTAPDVPDKTIATVLFSAGVAAVAGPGAPRPAEPRPAAPEAAA